MTAAVEASAAIQWSEIRVIQNTGYIPGVCGGIGTGAGTARVGRRPDLLSSRTSTGVTAPNFIKTS